MKERLEKLQKHFIMVSIVYESFKQNELSCQSAASHYRPHGRLRGKDSRLLTPFKWGAVRGEQRQSTAVASMSVAASRASLS